MNNLSIRLKIFMLIGIPSLVLFTTSLLILKEKYQELKSLDDLKEKMLVVSTASELVHNLQIERGTSISFLAKAVDIGELENTYIPSNEAIIKFKGSLINSNYSENLKSNILSKLNMVYVLRNQVKQNVMDSKRVLDEYSDIIKELLIININLSRLSNVSFVSSRLISQRIIEDSKEHGGRFRALVAETLEKRKPIPKELFREIVILHEGLEEVFLLKDIVLTKESQKLISSIQKGEDYNYINDAFESMIKKYASGNFSTPSRVFFFRTTKVLNSIQSVLFLEKNNMNVEIEKLYKKLELELILMMTSALALIFVTFTLFFLISRGLLLNVKRLIEAIRMYSRGEYTYKIGNFDKNELGLIAGALDDMSSNIQHLEDETAEKSLFMEIQQNTIDEVAIMAETNAEGIITYVNDRFVEISKFSREELIGQNHRILNSGYHSSDFFANMWKTIKSGKLWRGEIRNKTKDGDIYWVDTIIQPYIKNGVIEKFISVRFDVTKIKQSEEAALDALKAKANFLANMSHEIRTPMNGVIGLLPLLEENCKNEEEKKIIESIKFNGDHLLAIVNEILDYSKISSGKLELEEKNFAFVELLNNIFVASSNIANSKNVKIDLHISDKVPKVIFSDSLRITQVINNLLNNAIKFSEQDSTVYFIVESLNKTEDTAEIEIRVKDSGIGISEKEQAIIFDEFSQADTSTTRKYGGAGLGLSISYKLAKLLGGNIEVKSIKGVGSEFIFKFSASVASKMVKEKVDKNYLNMATTLSNEILVVEDDKMNQKVIKSQLKKLGYECDIANNGKEAVNMVKLKKYSVIFMDMQMPIMGGIEASKEIIKLFPTQKIITITANTQETDKKRCLESGMVDFMTKPIRIEELAEMILKWTSEKNLQHVS